MSNPALESAAGNAPLTSAKPPVLMSGKISEVTNNKRKAISLNQQAVGAECFKTYDTLPVDVLEGQ
jgi:hypothetical protein